MKSSNKKTGRIPGKSADLLNSVYNKPAFSKKLASAMSNGKVNEVKQILKKFGY